MAATTNMAADVGEKNAVTVTPQAEAEMGARLLADGIRMSAHDLLQHVQITRGYAQMLPESALRDKIVSACDREIEYIQRLQDVAHIHERRLELQREPDVDLLAIVTLVVQRSEQWPERRGSHRVNVVAADAAAGEWDRARVAQIVTHILSNALRYSPDGGKVTLKTSTSGSLAVLTVWDQGVGMSNAEIERAYLPFTRGEHSARYGYGEGLGLYLAQQLALLHGGGIGIESQPSVGTTVTVMLPR